MTSADVADAFEREAEQLDLHVKALATLGQVTPAEVIAYEAVAKRLRAKAGTYRQPDESTKPSVRLYARKVGVALAPEIVKFIRVHVDEDEQVANEASSAGPGGSELFVIDDDYKHATIAIPAGRVLAEVAAKRRRLDLYVRARDAAREAASAPIGDREDHLATLREVEAVEVALETTVRLDVLPYAGRPGFREEWRPA